MLIIGLLLRPKTSYPCTVCIVSCTRVVPKTSSRNQECPNCVCCSGKINPCCSVLRNSVCPAYQQFHSFTLRFESSPSPCQSPTPLGGW